MNFVSLGTTLLLIALLLVGQTVLAQATGGGTGAISKGFDAAAVELTGGFKGILKIYWIVCGIGAVVGGIIVFNKWTAGDPDTRKSVTFWAAAVIFAIVAPMIIEKVFGLS